MPPRGRRPGFKIGRTLANGTRLPYWVARNCVRDPMGFPDRTIPLPLHADDAELDRLCQEHTARLDAWIADPAVRERWRGPGYDGTVFGACRLYRTHPSSRFDRVKANTRKSYADSLKIIEATVGGRVIRRLTVLDCERWYEEWRKPGVVGHDPNDQPIMGKERIDRAHDAISMFKTVLRFCAKLRHAECKQLAEELELVRFEKGGAREEEMTYVQAAAFVRKALELGDAGIIPRERGLAMAIGVAAQFDLLLRQMDIIGEWKAPAVRGETAAPEQWSGWFTWERIPGWRWRMKTSKSKYRAAAEFDLANYPLLFPLLEAVPHAERTGAIVKGEHGLPIRARSYRNWFRAIARAAGIPDAVWLMDTRAGGATEADEAGADLDAIQAALTHSKKDTTLRYIRKRAGKIATVAEARAAKRAADEGGK